MKLKIQLSISSLLILTTLLFSKEIDNAYYLVAADAIRRGLIPYHDFFQFQYPPGAVYLYAAILDLLKNLLLQRLLFAGIILLASWLLIKFLIKRLSLEITPIYAFAVTALFLAVSPNSLRSYLLVESKGFFNVLSFMILTILLPLDIKKREFDKVLSSWVIGAAIVFIGQKLLNGPILLCFLGFIGVYQYFNKQTLGIKYWLYLFGSFSLISALALILLLDQAVYFQAYQSLLLVYGNAEQFSLEKFNSILFFSFLNYFFPLLLLPFVAKRPIFQQHQHLILQASSFVVGYCFVYNVAPKKTFLLYSQAPLLAVYVFLGLMLADGMRPHIGKSYWLTIAAPALAVFTLHNLYNDWRIPEALAHSHSLEEYHNIAQAEPIKGVNLPPAEAPKDWALHDEGSWLQGFAELSKGGLYEYLGMQALADYIAEHKSQLNPDGDKKYRYLYYALPILMAGEQPALENISGHVFLLHKPDPTYAEELQKNQVMTLDRFSSYLKDDESAGWILSHEDIDSLFTLRKTDFPCLEIQPLFVHPPFGLYRLINKEQRFEQKPFANLISQLNQETSIDEVIIPQELKMKLCDLKDLKKPYKIRRISDIQRCLPQQLKSPKAHVALLLPTKGIDSPPFQAEAVSQIKLKINSANLLSTSALGATPGVEKHLQSIETYLVNGATSCIPEGFLPLEDFKFSQAYYVSREGEVEMPSNGEITSPLYYLKPGKYQFQFNARGVTAEGTGTAIILQIIDLSTAKQAYGNQFYFSEKTQTITSELDVEAAGNYVFRFSFVNDAIIEGQDRNAFIQNVSLMPLNQTE